MLWCGGESLNVPLKECACRWWWECESFSLYYLFSILYSLYYLLSILSLFYLYSLKITKNIKSFFWKSRKSMKLTWGPHRIPWWKPCEKWPSAYLRPPKPLRFGCHLPTCARQRRSHPVIVRNYNLYRELAKNIDGMLRFPFVGNFVACVAQLELMTQ